MPSLLAILGETTTQAWRWLQLALEPDVSRWTIFRQLRRFFGAEFDRLETHDKNFPGFDIASLYRALASFHGDCCGEVRDLGSLACTNLRQYFDLCKFQPYYRNLKPAPPNFQRVPIDVAEEISVVINSLSLAVMNPEAGRSSVRPSAALSGGKAAREEPRVPEKIAVFLARGQSGPDYWEDMDARQVPQQQITINVACRFGAVADRFFSELEERRQRLSVFRGKVIDPVLHGGVIQSIGFRAIKRVEADDLILPAAIKELIHNSVIGFYNHRDVLQALGIEMKRGILLHGPPGTGKTSISLYLAGLLPHFTICVVSGDRLLYPREICRMARYLQPTMVVLEDIDLIAVARDSNGLATVLGELMNQIDGCEPTDQVLFMMNTNSLERLESAVRNRPGRVDQIIEIPIPDQGARKQLIARFARNLKLSIEDLDRVADATAGTTPAMLKEIVKRAAVSAIDRNGAEGTTVTVVEADLLLAAQQVQRMREPVAAGSMGFRQN